MASSRASGKAAGTAARTAAGVLGAGAAAAGGWILYSRYGANHHRPLSPAVEAERREFTGPGAGKISYYLDRAAAGRPLVLIHSINAAASAYEMRPLFERYRGRRPVYALDLPGFGLSDRSDRVYSPILYARSILDFLESELRGLETADVVALSLSCEFCARAALAHPERFHSLTMISPTGFSRGAIGTRHENRGARNRRIHALFSAPLWSQAFYDLLVSPPSIRYFLSKSFEGPIDRGLMRYDSATSHQPGARYAPLYFVSGQLFTPDARESLYPAVPVPLLVLYDRDGYTDFDRLPDFAARHRDWTAVRIPGTKGLPHFEKPDATAEALEAFWARVESTKAA